MGKNWKLKIFDIHSVFKEQLRCKKTVYNKYLRPNPGADE